MNKYLKKSKIGCTTNRNRDVARKHSSLYASSSHALAHTSNRNCSRSRIYSKGQDSLEDKPDIEKEEYIPASSYRMNGSNARSKQSKNSIATIKMRHTVCYRCHSRQMLAIAGSMSPLGWSFLSIARNPMSWSEGDSWNIELEFPEGARIEYKYVVLEDQDWTKQADEAAEGLVPLYRPSGRVLEPDTDSIVRQMAIVAWQPGPNLVYTVPTEVISTVHALECTCESKLFLNTQDEARKGGKVCNTENGLEIPLVERKDIWK